MSTAEYHMNLWGLPGAEVLYDDARSVWETQIEDQLDGDSWDIEEWEPADNRSFLPSSYWTTEQILEHHLIDSEITEDAYGFWDNTSSNPDVVAAFEAALDLWASKVRYRMADKLVATHKLTVIAGKPHLDGQPL